MRHNIFEDIDRLKKHYEAFWYNEIIDRAPVTIILDNPVQKQVPQRIYSSTKDQWLDVEFRAIQESVKVQNKIFLGDALPMVWPNMGPEIFSAWCGCGYEYGDTTTWSIPCIQDWDKDIENATLNMNHPLCKVTDQYTDILLELGREKFIVGLTDFHSGADHLAALREPEQLAIDMIENPEGIKKKLATSAQEFFRVYEHFYKKLRDHNMPITTWLPLLSWGKYYVVSNDFSTMVSNTMFEDIFLDGIVEECQYYDYAIYHLDGPGALRHLDSILDISELNAVQFVPGAGNEGYAKWVDVYQKIQKAGKGVWLGMPRIDELPLVFETLKPEGVFLSNVTGIKDELTAERVLKSVEKWSM